MTTAESPQDTEQLAAAGNAAATEEQPLAATKSGPETFRTFTDQPVASIGEPTSDRRILDSGIDMAFRATPLPLQWCKQMAGGHSDSYTVGVIEDIHRKDNLVLASGYLLNTPEADEASSLLTHKVSSPSVDIAGAEWHHADENGEKLDIDGLMEHLESGKPLFTVITKGEIIGTTLVAMPALGSTQIALNEGREPREAGLVASAAEEFRPRIYDHALFDNPKLPGPTLPTMNEAGRIYGHLAVFGQCHRSVQSECVLVPRSPSGYAHFHTSPSLRLDNGVRLPVGRLTTGCGHADPRLRSAPATAHYDDAGSCFALVRVGEDRHGIWFSGVAAPGATAELIEQGLSAPLSGDWRNFGQGLDLVAALAVNTPGFAVQGVDDNEGRPASLVASVGPSAAMATGAWVSREDLRTWIREAVLELRAEVVPLTAVDETEFENQSRGVITDVVTENPPEETAPPVKTPNEQIEEILAEAGL